MSGRPEHGTPLLHRELRWLIRLRWVAGLMVLGLAGINAGWLAWYGWASQMLILGAAILIYNASMWASLGPASREVSIRSLRAFGLAQIAFDLVCLTLLVTWTGGLRSPALGFYVFHMVFASTLLRPLWAYAAAIGATLMLAGALAITAALPTSRADLLIGAGWSASLLVTVFLSTRIAGALFRRELARLSHFRRLRALSSHLHAQERALVQHEKMVAMGQLAAGVAHEINNPLAGMNSLLELMERYPDRPRPEAAAQLRAQTERIQRIVSQLTAFAHPERGTPESADVNDVVRATLKLPGFEARLRKVALTCDFGDDRPQAVQARVITRALQQALMNLVINALDALAGRPDPRLTIRTGSDGAGPFIEISDNGPGIPPENLGRIFQPFFTTKPVGKGTGLGLSISQGLIAEQGGRLEVASPNGPHGGATFTIRLAAPAGSPAQAPLPTAIA